MTGVILGMAAAGALIIKLLDAPLPMSRSGWIYALGASALEGMGVLLLTRGEPWHSRFLLSVVAGSLLLASVTDLLLRQVYNFTWWPALCAALLLLGQRLRLCRLYGLREGLFRESLFFLLLFLILQLTVFCRMYGRADSYAFCVCALAGAARGMDGWGMLVHMLLSYGFLILVQALRRNIDEHGNLRQKAPFLPYIVAAFWIVLLWGR